MTATILDAKTALIVVNLQKGLIAQRGSHPMQHIVERASKLADAFRRHDLPVVLVNVVDTSRRTYRAATPKCGASCWMG